MNRPLLLVSAFGLAACHRSSVGVCSSTRPDSLAIRRDIEFLASPALAGRLTGSPGNDSAAAYIARRYAALGLRPLVENYYQPFVARPQAHAGVSSQLKTQNVVAYLRGRDVSVAGQYVVVGAHFDHLGTNAEFGAMDPNVPNAVRLGADDNASGTAAVLELARLFAAQPTRRSIVFVSFSGEEEGALGSEYFTTRSPLPLDSAVAMMNFDMVGRLRNDRLIVYGVATATEFPSLLDTANAAARLSTARQPEGVGPSDHSAFFLKGVPVLHFFTDLHPEYHRATDVPNLINAEGEARVVGLAERIIRDIADRPARLTYFRAPVPVASANRANTGVYFGSVPDMAGSDTPGLRLSGVTPGSPADLAGLKAGDIIVEFAGRPVTNLNTYSDAMYAHKPGDEVVVIAVRDGKRVTFNVKLGKRG